MVQVGYGLPMYIFFTAIKYKSFILNSSILIQSFFSIDCRPNFLQVMLQSSILRLSQLNGIQSDKCTINSELCYQKKGYCCKTNANLTKYLKTVHSWLFRTLKRLIGLRKIVTNDFWIAPFVISCISKTIRLSANNLYPCIWDKCLISVL